MKEFKLTFEDIFSGAKKIVTKKLTKIEQAKVKGSIGKFVLRQLDNGIVWQWKLTNIKENKS